MFEDMQPIEHSEEELLAAARIRSQKLNEVRQLEAVIRPVYVFKNSKGDLFLTEQDEASAIVYKQVQGTSHEYLGKTDNVEYLEDLRKIRAKVEEARKEAKAMPNMTDRINRMVEIDDNRKKAFATILQRLANRADKTIFPPSPRKLVGGNATPQQLASCGFKI